MIVVDVIFFLKLFFFVIVFGKLEKHFLLRHSV